MTRQRKLLPRQRIMQVSSLHPTAEIGTETKTMIGNRETVVPTSRLARWVWNGPLGPMAVSVLYVDSTRWQRKESFADAMTEKEPSRCDTSDKRGQKPALVDNRRLERETQAKIYSNHTRRITPLFVARGAWQARKNSRACLVFSFCVLFMQIDSC